MPTELARPHDVRLVDRFPRQCPWRTADPLATLHRLSDVAWSVIDRGGADPDSGNALALLDSVDICARCIDRYAGHRTIRRLRGTAGAAA